MLVGAIHFAPGRFVTGGRLFKASPGQGNLGGRAASGLHREHRVLHPALPRTCDRRCPGPTDRGNPAPLTSNREGATSNWPQKPIRPLISRQPGWSLLPERRLHPTTAAAEGNLGAGMRGSLDPGSCSRIVLDCSGRKVLYLPTKGSSASSNQRLWRDHGQEWLGAPTAERLVLLRKVRDKRGQKQVHAPSHGR